MIGSGSVLGFAKSAGPELYRTVVTRFPGFNWTVVVQQPTSVALAPIDGLATVQAGLKTSQQQIIAILVIVLVAVFVFAFFIAGLLSKTITRPLMDLRELADSVSKGDTSRTITLKSDDEIQDVAQAFERMRTSVSIIMKRIKEMKANR